MNPKYRSPWPDLPYEAWRETCSTLHLWTQIVGKVRLALTPWLNHGWHVPLYVTSRGLTTSPIAHGSRTFEILFDFCGNSLDIDVSDGSSVRMPLQPRSVAQFYRDLMRTLEALELPVTINVRPCEIPNAIAVDTDELHHVYDAEAARRFFQALVQIDRVFKQFRTGFIGKSSPVHFFWGSFDLAVTRFSGRTAPTFEGSVPGLAIDVMREAYSHEVSSAGFWPGGNGVDFPCFYSYQYPASDQFRHATVHPEGAFFSEQLREFLLPYGVVRASSDPDATLLAFLNSTYEAAAVTSKWDRTALERPLGKPRVPLQ
jgi:Family of unknown function (DUF5996)